MDQIKHLITALDAVAPKLTPDFWNKSMKATVDACEPEISAKHVNKLKKSCKTCSLCTNSLDSSSCSLVPHYELDSEYITASRLNPICSACLKVKDLAALIQLVAEVSANPTSKKLEAELVSIASHFLKVNGHDLSNSQAFHSAIATAFTLSQLCGSVPLKVPCHLVS